MYYIINIAMLKYLRRKLKADTDPCIDEETFHADVQYIESLWQRTPIGPLDMPLIDIGKGEPLVFVPILEHLEFVYARQIRAFSSRRRVLLYRRHESRTRPIGLAERAEELRQVLDSLGLERVDLVGHGDAAMVLFEFATRYPERCKSLIIVAQGADYEIAPHPFIWLLHELFVRLPVEYVVPAWFLRRLVVKYITARHNEKPINVRRGEGGVERMGEPLWSPVGGGFWGAREDHPGTAGDQREDEGDQGEVDQHVADQGDRKGRPYHTRGESADRSIVGAGLAAALFPPPALSRAPCILPRHLIEEQFRKIALWPFVYKFSELPIIHYYDMRQRLAQLTMPILLINRSDDVLSPESKTRWLAEHLPNCAGYYVVPGGERFFMYSQAEAVNSVIEKFFVLQSNH